MPGSATSFTDEVKGELVPLLPAKPCCQQAELRAIVGALGGGLEKSALSLSIPRSPLARKLVQLVKSTGGVIEGMARSRGGRRPAYRIALRPAHAQASSGNCCARAALRGAFLARGAVLSPGQGYHLELALPVAEDAMMTDVFHRLRLPVRRLARRGRTVFYLKAAEQISRVLRLVGANRAVMRLENDRVLREMRSQANRRVNSETANLDKRLRAARRQLELIHALMRRDPSLRELPAALRSTAMLRLHHPQARLQALAQLDHVTKSAMAHRLRRLQSWASRDGMVDSF